MTNIKSFVAAAVFAVTALASLGSANADPMGFLKDLNPAYTACVKRVDAQVQNTPQVHDAVITACSREYGAYKPAQASAPGRVAQPSGTVPGRVSGTVAKGIGGAVAAMRRG